MTLEEQITQLLLDLNKYKEDIKWVEQDKDIIQRLNAHGRVEKAKERLKELEPRIKDQFGNIFGEISAIRERERQAERIERDKIDEELKRLLSSMVEQHIATQSYELIKDEVTKLRNVIKGIPKVNPGERKIKETIRTLQHEVKNLSRKPVTVNLGESETMKEIFRLRKELANLGKEETEDIYAVYPPTGEKKEVGRGTLVIDFLTGDVTLPSGIVEHTNYRLENTVFEVMRSLSADTEKAIVIELDDGMKFTVGANQFYSIPKRKFRIAYIHCTETTKLRVYGSTSEDSAIRFEANVQNTDDQRYTTRIAYTGNNPEYIGEALPGVSEDDAVWRIKKLTYSGNNVTQIDWAGGSEKFTNVWSSRTTYTYT